MQIKVADILEGLAVGKLSNLSLADEANAAIIEAKIPQVITALNDVLLRLHVRFVVEGELNLRMIGTRKLYPLTAAGSIQGNPDGWIEDTAEAPFVHHVMQVLTVSDVDGWPVDFGNSFNNKGVKIIGADTVQLTSFDLKGPLKVTYRRGHEKISLFPDLDVAVVDLPEPLFNPLYAGIAAHIFGNMSGPEHLAKSGEQWQMFEALCNEVALTDATGETRSSEQNKLERRGFV